MQYVVSGEPEDVIDAIRFAPSHGLGAGIMAVAAPADARLRPDLPDVAGHVPDDGTNLGPARRLAFTQDDGNRLAGTAFVDVDRQEAALVVIGIEERELLAAMDPVESIIDVEHDRGGWARPTRAEQIDHRSHHPCDLDLRWCVLEPRHGRCEHSAFPLSGSRPTAILNAGSARKLSQSSASSYPAAIRNIRSRSISMSA